jgi:hypothetical protein
MMAVSCVVQHVAAANAEYGLLEGKVCMPKEPYKKSPVKLEETY